MREIANAAEMVAQHARRCAEEAIEGHEQPVIDEREAAYRWLAELDRRLDAYPELYGPLVPGYTEQDARERMVLVAEAYARGARPACRVCDAEDGSWVDLEETDGLSAVCSRCVDEAIEQGATPFRFRALR